jgi:hypothetical protein
VTSHLAENSAPLSGIGNRSLARCCKSSKAISVNFRLHVPKQNCGRVWSTAWRTVVGTKCRSNTPRRLVLYPWDTWTRARCKCVHALKQVRNVRPESNKAQSFWWLQCSMDRQRESAASSTSFPVSVEPSYPVTWYATHDIPAIRTCPIFLCGLARQSQSHIFASSLLDACLNSLGSQLPDGYRRELPGSLGSQSVRNRFGAP